MFYLYEYLVSPLKEKYTQVACARNKLHNLCESKDYNKYFLNIRKSGNKYLVINIHL